MLSQSVIWGTIGGTITAMSTLIGAAFVLFRQDPKQPEAKTLSKIFTFEFTIGMMVAASAYSLILPAYTQAHNANERSLLIIPLILGVLFILGSGKLIEVFQPQTKTEAQGSRAIVFIIAMMLHNLPEGLASGSALSPENPQALWSPVIAIALQNFPEGFLTAIAFYTLGVGRKKAFLGAALTAAVEFVGGIAGGASTSFWTMALPFLLAFAGSAMMFVSLRELIMENKTHQLSFTRLAVGFILFSFIGLILQ